MYLLIDEHFDIQQFVFFALPINITQSNIHYTKLINVLCNICFECNECNDNLFLLCLKMHKPIFYEGESA